MISFGVELNCQPTVVITETLGRILGLIRLPPTAVMPSSFTSMPFFSLPQRWHTLSSSTGIWDRTAELLAAINKAVPDCHATTAATMPIPLSSVKDLDITPPWGMGKLLIISCPHYSGGRPTFPPTDEGFASAMAHGRFFHSPFLGSLSVTEAASVGWYKCVPGCASLWLSKTKLDEH